MSLGVDVLSHQRYGLSYFIARVQKLNPHLFFFSKFVKISLKLSYRVLILLINPIEEIRGFAHDLYQVIIWLK
jgi:hypothetical protein